MMKFQFQVYIIVVRNFKAPVTSPAQTPSAQAAQTPSAQAAQTPSAQTPSAQTPSAQTPAAHYYWWCWAGLVTLKLKF